MRLDAAASLVSPLFTPVKSSDRWRGLQTAFYMATFCINLKLKNLSATPKQNSCFQKMIVMQVSSPEGEEQGEGSFFTKTIWNTRTVFLRFLYALFLCTCLFIQFLMRQTCDNFLRKPGQSLVIKELA